MSYIGNQPTSVAFLTDTFSGNGTTTVFTMSVAPATTSSILVSITGVLQDPSTYSVSGTTLTFSAAPPSGTGNISVRYLGIPASGVTTTAYRTVTEFTATAGQTTFSVPSYTVGYIDVYRNGVMLGSADYTASNGTTVVLAAGATAGDLIETISFFVSSVLNAIPASPASVGSSYIVDGAIAPVKLSTGGLYWDTSGNVGIGTASPDTKLVVGSIATGTLDSTYKGNIKIEGTETTLESQGGLEFKMTSDGYGAKIQTLSSGGTNLIFANRNASATWTERMRIDASGRVTMPFQVGFKAGRSGTAQTVANASACIFNTTSAAGGFNTGNAYNTSTGNFTAPVSGRYIFNASVIFESVANGTNFSDMTMQINGNVACYGLRQVYVTNTTGSSAFFVDKLDAILNLSAGDVVAIVNNTGSTKTLHANSAFSIFCGYLLG